jgi:hypothetical protein
MAINPEEEIYSEEEIKRRADAALKRMLRTPHKPHKESKAGKSAKRS